MNIANTIQDQLKGDISKLANLQITLCHLIEVNPKMAKALVTETVMPWIESMQNMVKFQELEIQGAEEQQDILLFSNAELIERCKKAGVDLPNFNEIEREVRQKRAQEQKKLWTGV